MANAQKKDIVSKIINTLESNSNFVVVGFDKITHRALDDLRKDLKKSDASINVVKNSLLEKAINKISQTKSEYRDIANKFLPLNDQSALLTFATDWITGLKKYHEAIKGNEFLKFKFGHIDETIYDQLTLNKLATLPGIDVLMAKILGSFKSPMARATRSMKSPMQKLVYVLQQSSQKA